MALQEIDMKEGLIMLFVDGERYEAIYDDSFYNNNMYKYHERKVNAEAVQAVFNPTHKFNGHPCMLFDDAKSFENAYSEMMLNKVDIMLKSVGIKQWSYGDLDETTEKRIIV